VSEYVVLCRIFRNSSGRSSKKPGRNASNGLHHTRMRVAVDVRSVSGRAWRKSQVFYVGRRIFLRNSVYLGSRYSFLNSGLLLISGSPGSRCL